MTPPNTKTRGTAEGQAAAKNIADARAKKEASRRITSGGVAVPNAADRAAGVTPTTTPTPTTPVITPSSLTPANAPVVTPTSTPVVGTKLQADLETQTEDALTKKVEQEKATAEASKGTAFQTYLDQLTQSKGLSTLKTEAYDVEGGVNDITPELNDINDQIRREQLSSRRAQEAITKGGGLKAGAQSEIANIQRESLAKQADLSIIQLAVQGRYDSAKEVADRAVTAQFEQQQQAIDIAKFDYTENKELFTNAEKREYDLLFADRERKLEEAKQNKQDMYNLGVQASADGAPASVVQRMFQAKTREEALAIGGSYIGALDRQMKQANIAQSYASISASNATRKAAEAAATGALSAEDNARFNSTPETASVRNATKYAEAAQNYKDAINTYGTGEAFGQGKGALGQAYSALVGATKDYYSLGTLDNGVQKLIALGIAEPSVFNLKSTQVGALDESLEASRQVIARDLERLNATTYAGSEELKSLASEADKVVNKTNAQALAKEEQDQLDEVFGSAQSTEAFSADVWLQ